MYYSEITERIERCAWEHLHKLSQEEYVDHSDLDKMKDWLKIVCMIRGLKKTDPEVFVKNNSTMVVEYIYSIEESRWHPEPIHTYVENYGSS